MTPHFDYSCPHCDAVAILFAGRVTVLHPSWCPRSRKSARSRSSDQRGRCTVLRLTDFGTIPFANASATANGHTGSIVDAGWTATPLELVPNARRIEPATAPSALSPDGAVFSVSFQMA